MQAGLSLCWSHIPHCWNTHVAAHICMFLFLMSHQQMIGVLSERLDEAGILAWLSGPEFKVNYSY